jgi:hypothetical protein
MAERGHDVRVLCVDGADGDSYSVRTENDGTVRVDRVNLPHTCRRDAPRRLAHLPQGDAISIAVSSSMRRPKGAAVSRMHV